MFQCSDKNGQEIFLKDLLTYETEIDDMGTLGEEEGHAIAFLSETVVEVQPINRGKPFSLPSNEVTVKDSLVQRVASLSTHEEFQALMQEAELRHNTAVAEGKKPRKKRTGTRTAAAPDPKDTVDLF